MMVEVVWHVSVNNQKFIVNLGSQEKIIYYMEQINTNADLLLSLYQVVL